MKKTRGIVMKISGKTTIIYSDSGDYLKIKTPKAAPSIGQVIEADLPVKNSLSTKFLKISSVAAIFVMALSLSIFNIVSGTDTAAAAIIMDTGTNNSMELLIDREANVLDVNKDSGDTSSSSLDLKGMDIYAAINLIIDKAHNQGAFKQSNSLILTSIIPMDNQRADVIDQTKLRNSIKQHMVEKKIAANMMVLMTDQKTKKAAQSLGMNVNQYQIYQRILEQETNQNTNPSYSKDTYHMLTEADTSLETLFPHDSMTITPQEDMYQETSKTTGNSMMTNDSMESMYSNQTPANPSQSESNTNQTNESIPSQSSMTNNHQAMENKSNSMSMPTKKDTAQPSEFGEHRMMD